MKKISDKRKQFILRRNKKLFRKKVKRNRGFRKARVLNKPLLRGGFGQNNQQFIPRQLEPLVLFAEPDFKLIGNTEQVISFINQLKSCRDLVGAISKVVINLDNVTSIDIGSINLLLSSIKELSIYGMTVEGTMPKHPLCRKIIFKSGYLEHMSDVSKDLKRNMKINETENTILIRGKDKTANKDVGVTIKRSMKHLMGYEMHYPPIYGIIQEMNGNSVEHAYKSKKHWLFGVNYLDDISVEKVAFTFTDNGFGVLGTLQRRFSKMVFDKIGWKTNEEILRGIFKREYNSRFKSQINRNKGLPVIKKAQEDGNIKNLIVITNDVSLHLGSNKSIKLNDGFSGTFYYWEIDKEIIERWKEK